MALGLAGVERPPAPSRVRRRSPWPAPPCGTRCAAARCAGPRALDRGALAGGERALDRRRAPRGALDVDPDLDAVGQRDQRAVAGVRVVEAQRRARQARACRASRSRSRRRSGASPSRPPSTIRTAARATIQRGAAAIRAARSRSSPESSASRRATSSGGCASSTDQTSTTWRSDSVIDSWKSKPRMVDKRGEGRLAPRASAPCSYPTSGRSGPSSRSSDETTQHIDGTGRHYRQHPCRRRTRASGNSILVHRSGSSFGQHRSWRGIERGVPGRLP